MNDFFAAIHQIGLIPVIKIQDANQAVPLAKALLRGGLQAAEITFRTDAAAESIQAISENVPEMRVCAGTVLTLEQAQKSGFRWGTGDYQPRHQSRNRHLVFGNGPTGDSRLCHSFGSGNLPAVGIDYGKTLPC